MSHTFTSIKSNQFTIGTISNTKTLQLGNQESIVARLLPERCLKLLKLNNIPTRQQFKFHFMDMPVGKS